VVARIGFKKKEEKDNACQHRHGQNKCVPALLELTGYGDGAAAKQKPVSQVAQQGKRCRPAPYV
jgi:hypothetical protein